MRERMEEEIERVARSTWRESDCQHGGSGCMRERWRKRWRDREGGMINMEGVGV